MGNIFENIKDMDTLKYYIETMKSSLSEYEYDLVLYVCGLLENRGISEEVQLYGKQVKIDKYIAPMIVDLNKHNIQTLACCSGLQAEHPCTKFKPEAGYIALEFNQNLLDYLKNNISNPIIDIMQGTCYFQPSISISIKTKDDKQLQDLWQLIWKTLIYWKEQGESRT